jgi:hypothetical protein
VTDSQEDDLDRLYATAKAGTSVREFLQHYSAIFPFIRAKNLTCDYRLGRGRLKRLRDELTIGAHFLSLHANANDRVQFPLDSGGTDCNWYSDRKRTIEITVVQGRERLNLMTELNETGEGRGFLGLTDDEPTHKFNEKMRQGRHAYSTDEAQQSMIHAIELCAQNKSRSSCDILLIGAPLGNLQMSRWLEIKNQLAAKVQRLPYSEIFVMGDGECKDCIQLKRQA